MRVGNIHEPQTGVDVTKISTEEALLRHLMSRGRTRRERLRSQTTPLNPTIKTPTSKTKAATMQTATLPSTKEPGSTTLCEQRSRQTTCWQQLESRRGSLEQDLVKTSKNDCQTPPSTLDTSCLQRKSTDINQPEPTDTTTISQATRHGSK